MEPDSPTAGDGSVRARLAGAPRLTVAGGRWRGRSCGRLMRAALMGKGEAWLVGEQVCARVERSGVEE